MKRYLVAVALAFLPLVAACGVDETTDQGAQQSSDLTGKTKYHYDPGVEGVTFNGGCGIVTDPPQQDCSYGFVLTYTKAYADLETKVTHSVNNTKHTLKITLDTWSYSQIHPLIATEPEDDDLGMLGTKAGHAYTVTVVDRDGVVLWKGQVDSQYHL